QIFPFLEFLISCFLGSEVVWCGEWASHPSRTPGNRNPSGWRTGGKSAGLARGMPNVSSTGLEGERSWSRAGRSAEDFDLDDEMLRAKDTFLSASEEPPGPRSLASQALTSSGGVVLLRLMIGWKSIDAPPTPRRPSVTGWDTLKGEPNLL